MPRPSRLRFFRFSVPPLTEEGRVCVYVRVYVCVALRARSRYGRWKAQQAAKEERKKSREERRARGEDVSEDEGEGEGVDGRPDASLALALGKILLFVLIGTALAGQFITGSPLWGYKGKWTNIHTYLAPFTVSRFTCCIRNHPLLVACTWLIKSFFFRFPE
jgi:hypothetical protein